MTGHNYALYNKTFIILSIYSHIILICVPTCNCTVRTINNYLIATGYFCNNVLHGTLINFHHKHKFAPAKMIKISCKKDLKQTIMINSYQNDLKLNVKSLLKILALVSRY